MDDEMYNLPINYVFVTTKWQRSLRSAYSKQLPKHIESAEALRVI
jgi:hypothetical protein